MSFDPEFKTKVLNDLKKQEEMKIKIKNIQNKLSNFEKGEISADKLISEINTQLGSKMSDKLERILKNPGYDNKDFRTVIKHLDIIKDSNTEYRIASEKLKNFNYNKKEQEDLRKKLKQSKFIK